MAGTALGFDGLPDANRAENQGKGSIGSRGDIVDPVQQQPPRFSVI